MKPCQCHEPHALKRVVLTGGPGAGKTAVLDLIRHAFCPHVAILPEAAGIIFGGGFPRLNDDASRRAAQRAIFRVQVELETIADVERDAVILCDRGTVDGGAYWPGPGELFPEVGTTLTEQLRRYDTVIHLRVPPPRDYTNGNPLRLESAIQAQQIDEAILAIWAGHPRRFILEPQQDFLAKAASALALLREEVPICCRPPAAMLQAWPTPTA